MFIFTLHTLFSIQMYSLAYHFPQLQRLILNTVMETKKTWEKHLQLIPVIRPSHCPSTEISNSASPRRWVLYIMYTAGLVDLQAYGYNTPCADASLRYLLVEIKFAKFDDSKITFKNVLSCSLPRARYTTPIAAEEA